VRAGKTRLFRDCFYRSDSRPLQVERKKLKFGKAEIWKAANHIAA
jgi:hypothetical protein